MADLPPPPTDSVLALQDGKPGPVWARWLQQLRDTVRGGALPYAFCTTATAQTLTNAATTSPINYSTKAADTDNAVTTGAGWKFTVPASKGGLYQVNAAASVATGGALGECILVLLKNGAEILRGNRLAMTASTAIVNPVLGATVSLAAGDYLQVGLYQSSGANRTLEAAATSNWVSIAGLRA
jgi:hypothetical protein